MSNHITDLVNGQEFESASPLAHAVRYDRAQVKTEEQKKQARENIGCYCEAGGGSGGSSGGGAFMVHASYDNETQATTLDKTAAEIFEAFKTMPVILAVDYVGVDENVVWMQTPLYRVMIAESGYTFISSSVLAGSSVVEQMYYAANDNDYPTDQEPDEPSDPEE